MAARRSPADSLGARVGRSGWVDVTAARIFAKTPAIRLVRSRPQGTGCLSQVGAFRAEGRGHSDDLTILHTYRRGRARRRSRARGGWAALLARRSFFSQLL